MNNWETDHLSPCVGYDKFFSNWKSIQNSWIGIFYTTEAVLLIIINHPSYCNSYHIWKEQKLQLLIIHQPVCRLAHKKRSKHEKCTDFFCLYGSLSFAQVIVVLVTAFNDWSKEKQFRGLQVSSKTTFTFSYRTTFISQTTFTFSYQTTFTFQLSDHFHFQLHFQTTFTFRSVVSWTF